MNELFWEIEKDIVPKTKQQITKWLGHTYKESSPKNNNIFYTEIEI